MITAPYILARNYEDSHRFARETLGLEPGTYRLVNSPATLAAVRGADLYLVDGWEYRFDRFSLKGALRWTRMNIIRVDERGPLTERDLEVAYRYNRLIGTVGGVPVYEHPSKEAAEAAAVADGLNPPGEQLTIDVADTVCILHDLRPSEECAHLPHGPVKDDSNGDNMTSEGGPAVEEKPVKRRRSRCKECGTLHFKGDPCPSDDDPFPVE